MDGFDDLLSGSKRILEENPFDDPFAKRSNSPDPWTSGWTQQPAEHAYAASHDVFGERSTTPTQEAALTTPVSSEPLDVAALQDDEPDPPLKSAGFRESTSEPSPPLALEPEPEPATAAEPVAIPSIPARDPTPPPVPSPPTPLAPAPAPTLSEPASTPVPAPASVPERKPTPPTSPSISSPTSSTHTSAPVVSPLEYPTSTAHIEQPFSNLALGGESSGGWHQPSWDPNPSANGWGSENDSSSAINGTVDGPATNSTTAADDDSDDDIPIAQAQAKRLSGGSVPPKPNQKSGPAVFTITVSDPQKVGDPIRGYTMYTVHTTTTSPLYPKSTFSVLRRYSDFLWLYETLSNNNPGVVVPPVPEKNPFGRFDENFVQNRRMALEKCINKTANHPVLAKDPDLKMFLESDTFALDIKHRKAEIAHERGGLMASLGQTIAGPRFYEMDEWFDKQKTYLDSLESQLKGLVKAIDHVARQRQELAVATGEFAQTIAELSQSDVGKSLAQSLASVAEVERKAQELEKGQAQDDMTTIMSTADEYARLINSVRLAFTGRIRTYNAWQSADTEVRRVKSAHEKNKAAGRIAPERLGWSLSQIADAERKALEARQEFDNCSRLIKQEVGRFEKERIEDFKRSLQAFLEGMIGRQKELIQSWEIYQQTLLKKVGALPSNGQQAQPSVQV